MQPQAKSLCLICHRHGSTGVLHCPRESSFYRSNKEHGMIVTNAWSGRTRLHDICRSRWIAVCAVVIGTAAALVSQTAQRPNRITQPLTSGGIVTIAGSVHPLTRRATDLGEVSSAMPMNEMTMNISLSAAQKTERDALLAAQQDPNSPQYHQPLTQEEYGRASG